MKTSNSLAVIPATAMFAAAFLITHFIIAAPATQPATQEQIVHDLTLDAVHLADAIPEDLDVSDQSARSKAGAVVIPIVHHALSLIDQLPPNCKGESLSSMKINWEPLLIVFGDAEFTRKKSEEAAKTGDVALNAKICLSLADLTLAGKDAAKAEVAAKRILDAARADPTNDDAAFALMHLREDDRLSTEAKSSATALLAQSQSRVAKDLRFAEKMVTTRPAP